MALLNHKETGESKPTGKKVARGKQLCPPDLVYRESELEAEELQLRLDRAFDVLFEEMIRVDNS